MTLYKCKKCGGMMEEVSAEFRDNTAYVFWECSACEHEAETIEEIVEI